MDLSQLYLADKEIIEISTCFFVLAHGVVPHLTAMMASCRLSAPWWILGPLFHIFLVGKWNRNSRFQFFLIELGSVGALVDGGTEQEEMG